MLLLLLHLQLGVVAAAPDSSAYTQPSWDRRVGADASPVHALLENAARLHQQGDLDLAVKDIKKAIQHEPKNGEAYALLSKCLSDQKKYDLADKAMSKASSIHNEALSNPSLF